MGASDWVVLSDSLGQVDRGATAGIARPNGGGDFVYGFNSLSLADGAVGLHATQQGFAPMSGGGSVRGAIQRGKSAGTANFAPFFFAALQGQSVEDEAYILGLADDDPHHIVLAKGPLIGGLPDIEPDPTGSGTTNPSGQKVLLRSTNAYLPGTWLHLRLDVILQGSGDVLLQVYESDLSTHSVTSPNWTIVGGMEGEFAPSFYGFMDDALGVNTGTQPLVGGRIGFGFQTTDVHRRGFFDHIQVGRQ